MQCVHNKNTSDINCSNYNFNYFTYSLTGTNQRMSQHRKLTAHHTKNNVVNWQLTTETACTRTR